MNNSISWLHLSDLHSRKSSKWDSDKVVRSLIEDLTLMQKDHGIRPDFIFFTGDAAFGTTREEKIEEQYAQFADFLDKVRKAFTPEIEKANVFIVPGNHDVDRTKILESDNDWLRDPKRQFEDVLYQFSNSESGMGLQWLGRLSAYRTFLTRYELYHLNPDQPQLLWANTRNCNGRKVKIVGLNTAWSCATNREKGELWMCGEWQKAIADTLVDEDSDISFALLHHPLNWMNEHEDPHLMRGFTRDFDFVLHGHEHSQFVRQEADGTCVISAGSCYEQSTTVNEYSVGTIDQIGNTKIYLRTWDKLGGGWVKKNIAKMAPDGVVSLKEIVGSNHSEHTLLEECEKELEIDQIMLNLENAFNEAATCFSNYSGTWADRDFSNQPENVKSENEAVIRSVDEIALSDDDCLICAPINFGLTCVGRKLCLQRYILSEGEDLYIYISGDVQSHKSAVEEYLSQELRKLGADQNKVKGVVIDDVDYDKSTKRLLKSIREISSEWRVIALNSRDDVAGLQYIGRENIFEGMAVLYLWSMSRSSVRRLICNSVGEYHLIPEDALVAKVLSDLDALNIHRTPFNCLTLVKINENQVDETPVNRTEMIRRVLTLYFNQFSAIPKYGNRPDLLDCENILGYFAEYLMRLGQTSFKKEEFFEKIIGFAKKQKLPVDADVLFLFLSTEKLIVRKDNNVFEFRHAYWLYFFAAHRMHHDHDFAEYILSNRNYAAYPEIMEFYSGLDRRRVDAVKQTSKDLEVLNREFEDRSGLSASFNLYECLKWKPTDESLQEMEKELDCTVNDLDLLQEEDVEKDKVYDRTRAYNQKVTRFIKESTLLELVQATRGAARVLRNSDYVNPEERQKLLVQVLLGWKHVTQVLMLIMPILARDRVAGYEGMNFYLQDGFSKDHGACTREILVALPYNVVNWYGEDLYSKKLGVLVSEYAETCECPIIGMLIRRVCIEQKCEGWEDVMRKYVNMENKESFYLFDTYNSLKDSLKRPHNNAKMISEIKQMAALAIARMGSGKDKPHKKVIGRFLNFVAEQ